MINLYVKIYCKIYTDTFPSLVDNVNSDLLYNWLIDDCNHCFDENEKLIKGDKIIWYLGSNEKFGEIKIILNEKKFHRRWSFGESNFENIIDMFTFCIDNQIFNTQQILKLSRIINEGKQQITSMYFIKDYLLYKRKKNK